MSDRETDEISFKVQGLSSKLYVVKLEGEEAISDLFRFDFTLSSDDAQIALSDVVGKPATLTFHDDKQRHVNGVVSRFEHTHDHALVSFYRLTLVPKAWRLQHRHDCRIFQAVTVPEIIEKVLKDAGLGSGDYALQMSGSYGPREYCVQYRESDFAFVSRLMEEEGIFYYFEHQDGAHKLVISDDPTNHGPIVDPKTVPFRQQSGALHMPDSITRFSIAEEVRPGKASITDFNFKKPSLSLMKNAQADLDSDLEIYDYPGEYALPDDGSKLAQVRLDELQAVRAVATGESGCRRLAPGFVFALSDHARDANNRGHLLTRVRHAVDTGEGRGERRYRNEFTAIPDDVPFRPARKTRRPTVRGSQTAIVTGASGDEIHTDEHGRVKVQFHWDRKGKKDDKSSCWIRVSQLWAGAGFGAMYIPRVGHEVIVDFLEGDPDQPIIVGRVYHGANVPPYPLPSEKTKSTIRTNSSPGGGGSNELRFEDKAGSEEIYLHGQKDWNIKIENDKNQVIGHDQTLDVGNDDTIHVAHDRKKTVDNDQSESIGGNKTIDVAKNHSETIQQNETIHVLGNESVTIGGNQTVKIDGTRTETVVLAHTENVALAQTSTIGGMWNKSVGGAMTLSVGLKKSESVGGSSTESVGAGKTLSVSGNFDETVKQDRSIAVTKKMTVTVQEDFTETIKKNRKADVGESVQLVCGDVTVTVKKDGTITVEGKDISVKSTGTVNVQAKKVQVKSDGAVDLKASGDVTVKGGNVKMN
jgi:type VI secretion system secreted protein VgrG